MNRNVNWGVMGTARIAGYGVIPGMLNSDNSNWSSNKIGCRISSASYYTRLPL